MCCWDIPDSLLIAISYVDFLLSIPYNHAMSSVIYWFPQDNIWVVFFKGQWLYSYTFFSLLREEGGANVSYCWRKLALPRMQSLQEHVTWLMWLRGWGHVCLRTYHITQQNTSHRSRCYYNTIKVVIEYQISMFMYNLLSRMLLRNENETMSELG